jgi:hypothetical protein
MGPFGVYIRIPEVAELDNSVHIQLRSLHEVEHKRRGIQRRQPDPAAEGFESFLAPWGVNDVPVNSWRTAKQS